MLAGLFATDGSQSVIGPTKLCPEGIGLVLLDLDDTVVADGTKIFLPEYEARIMAALPGRDFTVLERDGKPVLLLVDKESSTWPEEMRELSRSMVQEELRGAMSQLPRGQQLSEILFTDQPLPRTATGKVKRWEIHCP